ncbi:MAG: hypothetical protein WD757_04215 [Actinomycetota bacterium]
MRRRIAPTIGAVVRRRAFWLRVCGLRGTGANDALVGGFGPTGAIDTCDSDAGDTETGCEA